MMIAAALALPIMALAADYPWLTFRMADDTQFSVPAESLSMNYSDGNLHLTSIHPQGSQSRSRHSGE